MSIYRWGEPIAYTIGVENDRPRVLKIAIGALCMDVCREFGAHEKGAGYTEQICIHGQRYIAV